MKLIVFFNGWGMNNLNFSLENEWEFRYINYPYQYKYEKIDLKYEKIVFIGWSFGVYYLNKFLEENPFYQRYESIAINGTPNMLGERGISQKMLNYTLENLTEESLGKLYKNIGIYKESAEVKCNSPKDILKLKLELSDFINNYKKRKNYMKKAIISKQDRIVKFRDQKKYFIEKGSLIYEIDGEHFIFKEEKFKKRLVNILDEI
ncbi:MAG: pimeloyl-ACP methyl esterase BioG family protein [Cetobacterium sp.]